MDTNYSLPNEISTAVNQLADALLNDGPVAAYNRAKARLDGNAEAHELLEHYINTRSELHKLSTRNAVKQSDVDALIALQSQVQANKIITDYAETQQAAIAYLPSINQEISELLIC
jgi:cell fate (sporulation/competence/biofilm development) regulator YlbF (YheA/YmcA/DUF963 family)